MGIEHDISRRRLIESGAVLPAILLAACRHDDFADDKEHYYPLKAKGPIPNYFQFSEQLDLKYLDTILTELQKERGTKEQRIQAVKDDLSRVEVRGGASALMLCDSGYFLSAGHSFGALGDGELKPHTELSVVYHPRTGVLTPVKQFIIDANFDLAISFAPTGQPKHIIDHLQFRLTDLEDKERVSVLGLYKGKKDLELNMSLLKGNVDKQASMAMKHYQNLVVIQGLIPYGGLSGAPGLDSQGRVVTVESGSFPQDAPSRDKYLGATMSRVVDLRQILQEPKVFSLPTY